MWQRQRQRAKKIPQVRVHDLLQSPTFLPCLDAGVETSLQAYVGMLDRFCQNLMADVRTTKQSRSLSVVVDIC